MSVLKVYWYVLDLRYHNFCSGFQHVLQKAAAFLGAGLLSMTTLMSCLTLPAAAVLVSPNAGIARQALSRIVPWFLVRQSDCHERELGQRHSAVMCMALSYLW